MSHPSESSAPLESPESSSFPRVGLTAIGVAAIRAAESARPDRLFDDPMRPGSPEPLATGGPGSSAPPTEEAARRRRGLTAWITVRTRFLDERGARRLRRLVPPSGDSGSRARFPCLPVGVAPGHPPMGARPGRCHRVQGAGDPFRRVATALCPDHGAGRPVRGLGRAPRPRGLRHGPPRWRGWPKGCWPTSPRKCGTRSSLAPPPCRSRVAGWASPWPPPSAWPRGARRTRTATGFGVTTSPCGARPRPPTPLAGWPPMAGVPRSSTWLNDRPPTAGRSKRVPSVREGRGEARLVDATRL